MNLTEPNTPTILPPGEVNVWMLRLDVAPAKLVSLRALLNADEVKRADRLLRESDRAHFVAARGRLRQILAQYLAIEPRTVEFAYENRGKPFLKNPLPQPLHFNLSHSHGLALLAVSSTSPVGVDLEHVRDKGSSLDALGLARRFFSQSEYAAISAAENDAEVRQRFFTCWTRKEAFVKALGTGIAGGLDSFDVMKHENPEAPAAVFSHREDPSLAARWALRDLRMPEGFYASLCAHAPIAATPILTLP